MAAQQQAVFVDALLLLQQQLQQALDLGAGGFAQLHRPGGQAGQMRGSALAQVL